MAMAPLELTHLEDSKEWLVTNYDTSIVVHHLADLISDNHLL